MVAFFYLFFFHLKNIFCLLPSFLLQNIFISLVGQGGSIFLFFNNKIAKYFDDITT